MAAPRLHGQRPAILAAPFTRLVRRWWTGLLLRQCCRCAYCAWGCMRLVALHVGAPGAHSASPARPLCMSAWCTLSPAYSLPRTLTATVQHALLGGHPSRSHVAAPPTHLLTCTIQRALLGDHATCCSSTAPCMAPSHQTSCHPAGVDEEAGGEHRRREMRQAQPGTAAGAGPTSLEEGTDPLQRWFELHYALLAATGKLAAPGPGGNPESGALPEGLAYDAASRSIIWREQQQQQEQPRRRAAASDSDRSVPPP